MALTRMVRVTIASLMRKRHLKNRKMQVVCGTMKKTSLVTTKLKMKKERMSRSVTPFPLTQTPKKHKTIYRSQMMRLI